MRFYLGTDRPGWIATAPVPIMLSRFVLRRARIQRATTAWALDSGGFTELNREGRWSIDAATYAAEVTSIIERAGPPDWVAPQDWMCEPTVLARTGLTIADHQARTIDNYLDLRSRLGDMVIPVLQGWDVDDYRRHIGAYSAAGVNLAAARLVGVGTVCRRQATWAATEILTAIASHGIRIHAFGLKTAGLRNVSHLVASADSMAWCYSGWRRPDPTHTHRAKNCAHCMPYALAWRDRVLAGLLWAA